MTEENLPSEWEIVPLGQLCDINPSTDLSSLDDDTEISFVPMAAVEAGTGRLDASQTRVYSEVKKSSLRKFQEGDILFAKITPCMENGKFAIADDLVNGFGFGSTEFHVIRPLGGVSARYLLNFLLQHSVRENAERNMTGAVGQRRVPKSYLNELRVPVPPLAEQERIVDVLEEHLSRLDNAEELIRNILEKTRTLEKSILQHLIPEIAPESWEMITVGEAGEVSLGRQRHPDWHVGPAMKPYLRVANVFEDRLDLSDVMEMDFSGVFERFKLEPGDILLNEGQSPHLVGRSAMYRGELPEVAFTNSLLRFRARSDVLPEWALLVFRRHLHARRFMKEVRITTNIAHLSAKRLKSIEFPLPPLDIQEAIIGRAKALLGDVERFRRMVTDLIRKAAIARRRLLKDALMGKLLDQNSEAEPASVFLARLEVARVDQPKAK